MPLFHVPSVYNCVKSGTILDNFGRNCAYDRFFVSALQKSQRLDEHTGCINTVSWNNTGSLLVTGSDDRQIVIWDFLSGRVAHTIQTHHRNNIFCATFLNGDREIVTSAADGCVRLVDVESGSSSLLLESEVSAYCFKHVHDPNSNSTGLVTLSDGTVMQFDTRTGSTEELIYVRNDSTLRQLSSGRFTAPPSGTALAYNPMDPNMLALGTSTPAILIYDVRSLHEPVTRIIPSFTQTSSDNYPVETEAVSDIVWDKRHRFIVNYCRQDIIEVDYKMVTEETSRVQRRKFRVGESPEIPRQWSSRVNHQTFLKQVALFGNDQFIVSGGDCGNLFIWDRFGQQDIILKKPADPYVLNCVAVHPHLPVIATSGIASVADIWEPLAKFKSRITERRILAPDECTTISTPESFASQIETAKNLYALGNNLYQLNMFKEALSRFEEMADVLLGLRSVVPERNSLLEIAWNNCAAAMIQLRKYVDAVRILISNISLPFTAKIVGHEVVQDERLQDHVVYVVEVSRSDSPVKYFVYRRYSKFVLVDKLLESVHGIKRTTSWFSSWRRGTDPKLIEERKLFLAKLLDKFLNNFCDIVADFLKIPPEHEPRYNFSAVTSSVVTSGVMTPIDDSDEGIMRRLNAEKETAKKQDNIFFPIFKNIFNSINLRSNQALATDILRLVLEQIGDTYGVDKYLFLKFLSSLVSLEHPDAPIARYILNHRMTVTDWIHADLNFHVSINCCLCSNRLDVFRLLFALDKDESGLREIFSGNENSVSQYLLWRDRHVTFAEVLPGSQYGHQNQPPVGSPGIVSLLGPNSPMAAIPAKSSRTQQSVAMEASEWVLVSLSALDEGTTFFSTSTEQSSWRSVAIPLETASFILGDFTLWFRPSSLTGSSSEFEVKFEWQFPAHVNMEHVLALLYNPSELDSFISREMVDNFFGLVAEYNVAHNSFDEDKTMLVKKVTAFFDEPRKAVANLVVSAARGVANKTIVLAITSDPSTVRPSLVHRVIRSLHLGGCEVNVTTGLVKGLFSLSSDSIFLIAGDLLGERLLLWKALERFSIALKELSNQHIGDGNNGMSLWLRTIFSSNHI